MQEIEHRPQIVTIIVYKVLPKKTQTACGHAISPEASLGTDSNNSELVIINQLIKYLCRDHKIRGRHVTRFSPTVQNRLTQIHQLYYRRF